VPYVASEVLSFDGSPETAPTQYRWCAGVLSSIFATIAGVVRGAYAMLTSTAVLPHSAVILPGYSALLAAELS
jgi:hypothetical protein